MYIQNPCNVWNDIFVYQNATPRNYPLNNKYGNNNLSSLTYCIPHPFYIGNTPATNIRLRGGANEAEGRVEIQNTEGTFLGICDDQWGILDAQVVCRMLCYKYVVV